MRNTSVRVNVSVPGRVDALLRDLHELTGQSKASFVVEALTWYLPRLSVLRDRLQNPAVVLDLNREPRGVMVDPLDEQEEVGEAYLQHTGEAGAPAPLSRAERRRQEREERKLQKRMVRNTVKAS